MMSNKKLHNLLLEIAKLSYDEGRLHQYEIDHPEIGPDFRNLIFEETNIYKTIMKEKPKGVL